MDLGGAVQLDKKLSLRLFVIVDVRGRWGLSRYAIIISASSWPVATSLISTSCVWKFTPDCTSDAVLLVAARGRNRLEAIVQLDLEPTVRVC